MLCMQVRVLWQVYQVIPRMILQRWEIWKTKKLVAVISYIYFKLVKGLSRKV